MNTCHEWTVWASRCRPRSRVRRRIGCQSRVTHRTAPTALTLDMVRRRPADPRCQGVQVAALRSRSLGSGTSQTARPRPFPGPGRTAGRAAGPLQAAGFAAALPGGDTDAASVRRAPAAKPAAAKAPAARPRLRPGPGTGRGRARSGRCRSRVSAKRSARGPGLPDIAVRRPPTYHIERQAVGAVR